MDFDEDILRVCLAEKLEQNISNELKSICLTESGIETLKGIGIYMFG